MELKGRVLACQAEVSGQQDGSGGKDTLPCKSDDLSLTPWNLCKGGKSPNPIKLSSAIHTHTQCSQFLEYLDTEPDSTGSL